MAASLAKVWKYTGCPELVWINHHTAISCVDAIFTEAHIRATSAICRHTNMGMFFHIILCTCFLVVANVWCILLYGMSWISPNVQVSMHRQNWNKRLMESGTQVSAIFGGGGGIRRCWCVEIGWTTNKSHQMTFDKIRICQKQTKCTRFSDCSMNIQYSQFFLKIHTMKSVLVGILLIFVVRFALWSRLSCKISNFHLLFCNLFVPECQFRIQSTYKVTNTIEWNHYQIRLNRPIDKSINSHSEANSNGNIKHAKSQDKYNDNGKQSNGNLSPTCFNERCIGY